MVLECSNNESKLHYYSLNCGSNVFHLQLQKASENLMPTNACWRGPEARAAVGLGHRRDQELVRHRARLLLRAEQPGREEGVGRELDLAVAALGTR